MELAKKAAKMARMKAQGISVAEIAKVFGVTKPYVNSLLRSFGYSAIPSDKESFRKFGMSASSFLALARRGVYARFVEQKANAYLRGIEWELSLAEWWGLWEASGFWNQRGRTGYCMARKGDTGPYSENNVYFCPTSQNGKNGGGRRG